jgi:hypothetical protein
LDEAPLPVYVVLVIQLNRFLPDEMLIITRDVQDRLNHFRDDVFAINGQDMYLVTLEDGDAGI